MNKVWTSIKKYKKSLVFLSIIFIIGLTCGFIYFHLIKDKIVIDISKELVNLNISLTNVFYHIIILSFIIILSLFLIGNFLGIFICFYEALSIGFLLAAFSNFYNLAGLVYGIIYILIFKSSYIVFLTLIFIKLFNCSKNIIGYFILKKDQTLKDAGINNFVYVLKMFLLLLFNDLLLLLIGKHIIKIFSFLII